MYWNRKTTKFISTAPSGNDCICTYADMKYVMQEIRILESANNYLPDVMKTHRNENGKFYQIGGPTENGTWMSPCLLMTPDCVLW